ncbi:helix-turn-helix domain-containing protein [Perlabentimonas gracilis]|uniref:helix-turn-helix domain-containing protein n=1 Tax=Perlabentimonas gracilis TaxID=2715279 RepID=UPI001409F2BD|nr:helix-turn-helix transcriptional regulator [Perlabentimonas gracilis]
MEKKRIKKNCELENTDLYLSMIDKHKTSSQMKESFGEYIRKLRNEKGLTLTQLAARLDLDSANLSKIENGKRDFDEKRLEKLSEIFELDIINLKKEFYSEMIARKIYSVDCPCDTLHLAEQKINYLKQNNIKQTAIKF